MKKKTLKWTKIMTANFHISTKKNLASIEWLIPYVKYKHYFTLTGMKVIPKVKKQNNTIRETKNLKEVRSQKLANLQCIYKNKLEKVTLKTSIQIIRFSKNEKVFYVWKKISLKTLRWPFLINNCIWTHQQIRK